MSSALISRSPDLTRLRDEGFEVQIHEAYLLVSGVPYVTDKKEVARGTLVSTLNLADNKTARPSDHVVLWIGSHPCYKDGTPIQALGGGPVSQALGNGLITTRNFSNKPPEGYPDYYAKMTRYISVFSDQARAIEAGADARTFKPIVSVEADSPFVYADTNSSRAHINAVSAKLRGQRIGIVGVGGTGSYVLDLVSKTPVSEIHLWDGDRYFQHNAFRAPGGTPLEKLAGSPAKVHHWKEVYSHMHRGIVAHPEHVTGANVELLKGYHFVFLCMDSSEVKRAVMDYLIKHGIPFVDTGLGVQAVDESLIGMTRATTATSKKHDHINVRVSCVETAEDDYSTNIQIAELNALAATLAVIKWKKLLGFYLDYENEHHTTYTVSGNMLLCEDPHP